MTAKRKPGRPKEPVPEDPAEAICEWLETGQSLEDWCAADPDRPSARLVRKWKDKDPTGFGAAYARAREIGGEAIAQRMRKLASEPSNHPDDVAHRRLQIDVEKWLLARWFPTLFGDRAQVDHAGGVTIQVTTGVPRDGA